MHRPYETSSHEMRLPHWQVIAGGGSGDVLPINPTRLILVVHVPPCLVSI
jgi:hypothetical protein